jgi:hypothetical protein
LTEDLIRLWQDYKFMLYCDSIWSKDKRIQVTEQDRDYCRQILSRASSSLVKILQIVASQVISYDKGMLAANPLLTIRLLFNFSWDELRTAICSLRSLIDEEGEELTRKVSIVASNPVLCPVQFYSEMWDLTCGSLDVMLRIFKGELDITMA